MKIKYILFLFITVLGFVSCEKSDKKEETATRTVLVYMVASDLDNYGFLQANINEMIEVANKKNLNGGNLVVFYSKYNKTSNTLNGELFQIKEGNGGVVTRHYIRDYNEVSAIDPQTMRTIVDDVFNQFPAQSYGMIMSSHASAWFPSNYRSMLRSFGEENGKYMEIPDLAKALSGLPLDFIAFDACSMGAIECAYELKNCTDYFISSTSEIMGKGFPFKTILPYFFTSTPGYENIARSFHNYYQTYENPYGNISVVKTASLDDVAAATKEIINEAGMDGIYGLTLDNMQVLSYLTSSPTKLYDFGQVILSLPSSQDLKNNFNEALTKAVISKYSTDDIYCQGFSASRRVIPVTTFSGLTIYPMQKHLTTLNDWYKTNLKWYQAVYQ